MATASTGACNQCESVSAAPGSDSCEAGSAKKTVVALYAGTGKLSSPCAGSHKTLFYANDFSYLSKKEIDTNCLGDGLKNRKVGKFGTLSLGGQMRWRYQNEQGMGQQAV